MCGRRSGTSEDPFWTSDLDWNRLRYHKTLTLLQFTTEVMENDAGLNRLVLFFEARSAG